MHRAAMNDTQLNQRREYRKAMRRKIAGFPARIKLTMALFAVGSGYILWEAAVTGKIRVGGRTGTTGVHFTDDPVLFIFSATVLTVVFTLFAIGTLISVFSEPE
jgi:hypothetical protein